VKGRLQNALPFLHNKAYARRFSRQSYWNQQMLLVYYDSSYDRAFVSGNITTCHMFIQNLKLKCCVLFSKTGNAIF